MRVNLPVTQNEQALRDGCLVVSMTDLKGRITSINSEFVQVSGLTKQQLIGKAHDVVRHPDMPEEAYADSHARQSPSAVRGAHAACPAPSRTAVAA